MQTIQEKLDRGIDLLNEAGNDSDLLGAALLKLHGALEDHFRGLLTTKHNIPTDVNQVQWVELVNLMQQHEGLSTSDRGLILSMNSLRNPLAHGGLFTGTRSQVENYAEYVKQAVGQTAYSYENNVSVREDNNQKSDYSSGYNISNHESNYSDLTSLPDFDFMFFSSMPLAKVTLNKSTGRVLDLKERKYTKNKSVITNLEVWLQLQSGKEEFLTLLDWTPPLRRGQMISVIYGTCNKKSTCVALNIPEMKMHYCKNDVWTDLPVRMHFISRVLLAIVTIVATLVLLSLFPVVIVQLFTSPSFIQFIVPFMFLMLGWYCVIFGIPAMICHNFNKQFKIYLFKMMDR